MRTAAHPLVDDYLRALDEAGRVLPRRDRDELVEQIREHIEAALPPGATEAEVRNTLDRLGTPRDIVAAAGGVTRVARRGAREAFAVVLLASGFPPVIGWLAGAGLLLWSPLWTARQKLLGILAWPGGLVGVFFVLGAIPTSSASGVICSGSTASVALDCQSTSSSGPPAWVSPLLAFVLFVVPLLVAAHLWRAAGRRSG